MVRRLRKHWKLAAIAVFSLSVAMALGVLALSLSDTFLLASPAAPDADRLVTIYSHTSTEAVGEISYPDYQYFRQHNHVFTDIAAAPNSIAINGEPNFGGHEVKVLSRPVSNNYFTVLGIRPELGSSPRPGEDSGGRPAAMMTYACWKRLGGDPNIIGKKMFGQTIVGVTPENFTGGFFGLNGDLFVSMTDRRDWEKRDARHLILLARLKPGVTRAEAQAEMTALAGQLSSAYPEADKGRSVMVRQARLLPPDALATAQLALGILGGVVFLVLLIACANVANLLLAVAVGRRQEAAIKLALGAQRGRLVREFLRESALLCAVSSAIGYGIAWAVVRQFSGLRLDFGILGTFSFGIHLHLNVTVIGFTLLLTLIAVVATGLAPALYASSPGLAEILRGEIVVGGTRRNVRRNVLVIAQVAICTLVLVGMGLCQRNLYNLRHVDTGFTARNLVAVQVYPASQEMTEAQLPSLYRRLREATAAIPGVDSVAIAEELPLSLGFGSARVEVPGREKIRINRNTVDGGYFSTFGIPVLEGRGFNSGDRAGGANVVVVNRKMAEMLWPGEDAVGKALRVEESQTAGRPEFQATVVGLVPNGKYTDFDEADSAAFFDPLSQHVRMGFSIVARTKGDPRQWVQPLAKVVRDAGLTMVFDPQTYEGWTSFTLIQQRIAAQIVEGLSALGLLLAVLGLAGAISYSVSERKKELGIRVALGAGTWRLMGMILQQTIRVAGAGIALGIVLGVAATSLLRSRFFGIGVVECTVLIPVAAGMLAASLAVAYASARPWIDVNPMEAVRHA